MSNGGFPQSKPRLILFLYLSARRRGLVRNPRGLFEFFAGGKFFAGGCIIIALMVSCYCMNKQRKNSIKSRVFFYSFLKPRELLFAL
ncbi:TPA: hypothetical protein DCL28_01785 [Candidatus Komeilibacteria bacterium]|nr:MAG: hypothetical protein A2260_00915 [Candidatus Komeilibacteria bacterium RIFOXYA2_FULL_45_9]HAH04272.1 hypothetical protein [Candidatus Komeilibacteria bacterium]